MAHNVICTICGKRFDRDKESYVKVSSRRYAHGSCAEKEYLLDPNKKEKPVIINPNNYTTCIYCNKEINKEKDFYVPVKNKFAHKDCFEKEQNRELTDEEKLNIYIKKLFNVEFVSPKIKKQIKSYVKEYNYSYSGIKSTLTYFFEIKGNSIEKANDGIGIVPYVYKEAKEYYYKIWLANKKNKNKKTHELEKEIIVLKSLPKRKSKVFKSFSFLDE